MFYYFLLCKNICVATQLYPSCLTHYWHSHLWLLTTWVPSDTSPYWYHRLLGHYYSVISYYIVTRVTCSIKDPLSTADFLRRYFIIWLVCLRTDRDLLLDCQRHAFYAVPLHQEEPRAHCTRTNPGPTAPGRTQGPLHQDEHRAYVTRPGVWLSKQIIFFYN